MSLSSLSCSDLSRSDPDDLDVAWVDALSKVSSSSDASSSSTTVSSSSDVSSSSVSVSSSSEAATSSSSNNSAPLDAKACTHTPGTGSPAYGSLACAEKVYKTVKIGFAVWMAENLDYGTRVNGYASSDDQSNDAVAEKYCYGDVEANCDSDGALYQWAEAMQLSSTCNTSTCAGKISSGHHQGICPNGWHVPKASEWTALTTALGATESTVGARMKFKNSGNTGWDAATYNDGNSSGFSALPAGYRSNGGDFSYRGGNAFFWGAAENGVSLAYNHYLFGGSADLYFENNSKMLGLSVRCVMD